MLKLWGFFVFQRIWVNILTKKVSNDLCCKYSQKVIDYATKSDTDALKTSSERVIQKSNLI